MDYRAASLSVTLFSRLSLSLTRHAVSVPIRSCEFRVLFLISASDEAVSPAIISSFLGISKPSATAFIKNLIRDGYLERIPSKLDKRSYSLALTKKGTQLISLAQEEYTKGLIQLQNEMGDQDFEELIRLIEDANRILRKT